MSDDEIVRVVVDFALAAEREAPREMAALMCEEEARYFLERDFPFEDDPLVVEDLPPLHVVAVRRFGDLALVRFTRRTPDIRTVYLRREDGRWTMCEHAEDELSAAQLDEGPAEHPLSRKPVGALTDGELGDLLAAGICLGVLVPKALDRVEWQVWHGELSDLATSLFAVDPGYWVSDAISSVRARGLAEQLARSRRRS